MMRNILYLLGILLGGYLVVAALVYVLQSHMMYAPRRHLTATPSDMGLAFERIEFETSDQISLIGWWVPAADASTTVLFCHGNAGNISGLMERIALFQDLGMSLFAFDYRGYGESGGHPTERGTYLDAEAAWSVLVHRLGILEREIVVYGLSLGGPIAARLAGLRTPAGLVLEGTFTSLPDLASELFPIFPARFLARYEYPTLDFVQKVDCPVLIVHSREDRLVRIAHATRLLESASEPKQFLEVEGAHGDVLSRSAVPYASALAKFAYDSSGR